MNKKNLTVIAMCLGVFLTLLDTTVMNIALPSIQVTLNTNLTALNWALNVYSLLFAALAIPLGRLAGRIGRNKSFLIGITIFLMGSLASGLAGNVIFLIAGRLMQAFGAAIVLPLSTAIAYSTVATKNRKPIIAAVALTQGLAGALGPSIGGVLTQYLSWRWAFFVNIPIILLIVVLCIYTLDYKHETVSKEKIDIIGSVLCILTLFTLTLALIQGSVWQWTSPAILSLFAISLVSLFVFIWYENRIDYSMIPMRLFSYRQFNGAALTMVLSTVFFVGVFIVLPTYFVKIQHQTELVASLFLTIISIGLSVFSPLASMLITKIGARLTIFSGFVLMGGSYSLFATINTASTIHIYLACTLLGAGYGLLLGPVQVLGAGDFKDELLTASQSVLFVLRQVGLVLAFAVFVSVLNSHIQEIGTKYTAISSFTSIYKIAFLFVFLSSMVSLLFRRNRKRIS